MSKTRLDNQIKSELRNLAKKQIYENFKKMKFYDELKEFNEYLSEKVRKEVSEVLTDNKIKTYNEVLKYLNPSNSLILFKSNDISLQMIKSINFKYNFNFFNYFNDFYNEFAKMHFKKMVNWGSNTLRYCLYEISDELLSEFRIYMMMMDDVVRFLDYEFRAFDFLIKKKTTFNSLGKVWPEALANEDKILKILGKVSGCGILSDYTAEKIVSGSSM